MRQPKRKISISFFTINEIILDYYFSFTCSFNLSIISAAFFLTFFRTRTIRDRSTRCQTRDRKNAAVKVSGAALGSQNNHGAVAESKDRVDDRSPILARTATAVDEATRGTNNENERRTAIASPRISLFNIRLYYSRNYVQRDSICLGFRLTHSRSRARLLSFAHRPKFLFRLSRIKSRE